MQNICDQLKKYIDDNKLNADATMYTLNDWFAVNPYVKCYQLCLFIGQVAKDRHNGASLSFTDLLQDTQQVIYVLTDDVSREETDQVRRSILVAMYAWYSEMIQKMIVSASIRDVDELMAIMKREPNIFAIDMPKTGASI